MTELDLYKFVQDKEMDWRGDRLILWIDAFSLTEFAELLGDNYLCEGGIEVVLLSHGTIGVDLTDHLDNFDIEPERILARKD